MLRLRTLGERRKAFLLLQKMRRKGRRGSASSRTMQALTWVSVVNPLTLRSTMNVRDSNDVDEGESGGRRS